MPYTYDVFLSYSSKDKQDVLELAQRLKHDGLRVWFDEWEIKVANPIFDRVTAGLNASRVLVFVMSKNGMGSKWSSLEKSTFIGRDPTNKMGRFIPLRLDDSKVDAVLNVFRHIDWRKKSENEYAQLLEACRPKKIKTVSTIDQASIARVYDYFLGGNYNTAADRLAANKLQKAYPNFKRVLISNRAFLRRAVRFLSKAGIKQFLDIGSGLPTRGNTHEIAQGVCPDAKVVYVDYDKQVVEASNNLMRGQPNVRVILGDLTDPDSFFTRSGMGIINFNEPVALLLVAVVHFIPNDDLACKSVQALRRRLVPGSYLVISHASRPIGMGHITKPFGEIYRHAIAPVVQRQKKTLLPFFSGTALVRPGLVFAPAWHPKIKDPYIRRSVQLPFLHEPKESLILAGVGRIRNMKKGKSRGTH